MEQKLLGRLQNVFFSSEKFHVSQRFIPQIVLLPGFPKGRDVKAS
jgi:hypothetical protein